MRSRNEEFIELETPLIQLITGYDNLMCVEQGCMYSGCHLFSEMLYWWLLMIFEQNN